MWYQLEIDACSPEEAENLSDFLESSGALSITFVDKNDDPILEPPLGTTPLWPEVILKALYLDEKIAEDSSQILKHSFPHLSTHISYIPNQDWERAWMADFKPQQFGERLWICPSWSTPPDPKAIYLTLDPGLAFGTGSHQTTNLCLTWLSHATLENKTIIDYGCGSGILALSALKLGAKQAYAVDIDPQALKATQNNAKINSIESQQLRISSPDQLDSKADLMIANILLTPLLALKAKFKQHLNDRGLLIVSGILNEQAAELIDAYREDFAHQSTETLDDWSLLVFKRC